MSITFKVFLNLNYLDKKIFWARKSLKSFCHFNARNLFLVCYTFCGKQKDINKHQGNISSIHIYDTWECRTSKNTRKSKFRNQFDQKNPFWLCKTYFPGARYNIFQKELLELNWKFSFRSMTYSLCIFRIHSKLKNYKCHSGSTVVHNDKVS